MDKFTRDCREVDYAFLRANKKIIRSSCRMYVGLFIWMTFIYGPWMCVCASKAVARGDWIQAGIDVCLVLGFLCWYAHLMRENIKSRKGMRDSAAKVLWACRRKRQWLAKVNKEMLDE